MVFVLFSVANVSYLYQFVLVLAVKSRIALSSEGGMEALDCRMEFSFRALTLPLITRLTDPTETHVGCLVLAEYFQMCYW